MRYKLSSILYLLLGVVAACEAHAIGPGPIGELSAMGALSKNNLGGTSYETTRRYTATFGLNVTSVTEIEASYSFTDSFVNEDPTQTTDVNEQTLGLSIIQSLVPYSFWVQPYVKVGVAQYNRFQSGTIYGVPTLNIETKSPCAVLGGGLRVFFLRNFSLKVEGVTYLPDFHMSGAKNNFGVQGGIGWSF